MSEDFSFEAMERKVRIAKGKPLTDQELAHIKEQADEIARLEKNLKDAQEAQAIAAEKAEFTRIFEATVREVEGEKEEDDSLKLNPVVVGLLTILFLPAAFLRHKMKLSTFWVRLISSITNLIILIAAGYGAYRLLKWIF